VAREYDRLRPGPPEEALDWLIPPDCATAVDVAAGTGLFSRALRRRVGQVIAIEPDARMCAVLMENSPGVEVVAGRGESIPVPDGSMDAVFVSGAWQWLDLDQAVPEIARVEDVVGWLATYSSVIMAPGEEREAGLARAREALRRRANAAGMVEIPVRSSCWRADREQR
jgi:ubiquinone/menaquinone biosynthesis C-methylase UbiE